MANKARPDETRRIRVIDETLREGMQFHGLVFSLEQRTAILEFQEMLGVDISQTGYPSALDREAEIVAALAAHARKKGFGIRTAALGRAIPLDAELLMKTGVDDPHFHFHLPHGAGKTQVTAALEKLGALFDHVNKKRPQARISLAMLDMGRTSPELLKAVVNDFNGAEQPDRCPAFLSLPDTSGIMAPNQVHERISALARDLNRLKLSVHCHNDMGMATANTLTGVLAGADIFEASALGLGERNGIADLYATARMLENQGLATGLDLENLDGFKAYYTYVNRIVKEQTGLNPMGYLCPAFGEGVSTHVAGTHAQGNYGAEGKGQFFLNPLCGRGLVKKFLETRGISVPGPDLESLTLAVKQASMERGRALSAKEVMDLLKKNQRKNH